MWVQIVVIFSSAFTIGLSIANLIYFDKLRSGTCKEVSSGTATAMF
jgi:hypothetical protein